MKPLYLITVRMDMTSRGQTVTTHSTQLTEKTPCAIHKENVLRDAAYIHDNPGFLVVSSIIMAAEVTPEEANLLGFKDNGKLQVTA